MPNQNIQYNTRYDIPPRSDQNQDNGEPLYRVQVGAYRNKDNADRMLNSLLIEGFPAFIIYEDGLYKVQVGAFRYLSNAVKMERRLRRFRYNTYIVYS
ncbi:MAG: SPOR domain-containing protein [Lachnospira sp.]|nr:SPOR domain-containing protein [Lachnospira sp.]